MSVSTTEDERRNGSPLPPSVSLEELDVESGRMEFDGRNNSNLRRKMWIIRARENEYLKINFALVENNLGRNAYLTVWKEGGGFGQEAYSGSQKNWMGQREFDWVDIFVVTLTIRNNSGESAAESPSFKLRYDVIKGGTYWRRSTETMRKNGLQFVSYPPQNKQYYHLRSVFTGVIAPENGNPFKLTLKHLDIPCSQAYFSLYLLKESPTETKFERQTYPSVSLCGRKGNVSEVIGTSTVALIKFNPITYGARATGKGFLFEVDTSN